MRCAVAAVVVAIAAVAHVIALIAVIVIDVNARQRFSSSSIRKDVTSANSLRCHPPVVTSLPSRWLAVIAMNGGL